MHVLFLLVGDLPAVWTPRVGRHVPADPDQGRVRRQREARRVLVVRRAVEVPGAAQPEAAQGLRLMFLRGPGGGHQHPRTLRRALQLLPGRALGGGEGGLHALGVGGAVHQGAGTLEVGLHPASAARLGAAGTNMLGYVEWR